MATPRLFSRKIIRNSKFPLSSLVRTQQHFSYNYKYGNHATAPFVCTRRKFQTNSFLKSIYDVEKNWNKIYVNEFAKPLDYLNSLFYKSIYLLTSPKSSYNELSYSRSNKDDDRSDEGDRDGQRGDDPGKEPSNGRRLMYGIIGTLGVLMLLSDIRDTLDVSTEPETSWSTFLRLMLQTGEVSHLTVSHDKDKVHVFLRRDAVINGLPVNSFGPHYFFRIGNFERFEEKMEMEQEKLGISPSEFIPISYTDPNLYTLSYRVATVTFLAMVFSAVFVYLSRKKGTSFKTPTLFTTRHTRAKATIITPEKGKGVGFKDVAGMHEAKEEVKEFINYLTDPARFKELGAKMPKGALLCGPPGTGKTLLAKAVSTEAEVPFLSMAGSDFVEMFGGVGAARVRDLFAQARNHAPCIVYIDEVDAIGRARSSNNVGNSEEESTLNQLLVEMDGMNSVEGVLMLASTNRPDILDNALLRPGRFDRNITIDLPTLPERKEIFMIYLKKLKLGEGSLYKYAKRLAELTPGKTGADIANICNEAALHAAKLSGKTVNDDNFEYAIERVIAGLQRNNNPLSTEERKMVAYHEAGHVIVNWMLEHTEPIIKISTIPRTHSPLGFIQKFPLDIKLHTNEQLFDMMCSALGGRIAEALTFHKISTGAEDDLKRVTDLAYKQITLFGMNKRIGPISFPPKSKGEMSKKPYGDKLARKIDEEASLMVAEAHKVAEGILQDNLDKLETLASALLEKEVLNYDELAGLIGQSPHGDKMKKYYSNQLKDESDPGFKPGPGL